MVADTARPAQPRYFIAGTDVREASYQQLTEHMRVPADVVAGLDLLTDDGMDADKAAPLLMAAHRDGRDAEAFARHLLKLRKAVRP